MALTKVDAQLLNGAVTADSSGNIGIGVTPSAWGAGYKAIEVGSVGTALFSATATNTSYLNNTYYNGTSFLFAGTGYASRYQQNAGVHSWQTSSASGTAGNAVTFNTNMTLDSSGNVGIGTTSPAGKLHINGGTLTNGSSPVLTQTIRSGTVTYLDIYQGYNSTIAGQSMFGSTLVSTDALAFATSSLERMRIDSSGNLLVGQTTSDAKVAITYPGGASLNGLRLSTPSSSTSTAVQFVYNQVNQVGTITTTTTATAYNTSSDYRLKENVAPMQNALATVQALKPVTYNWKSDGSASQGFIAHELQAVVPDCVTGEKDAVDEEGNPVYQGIDTSFLVATLTAAIQELKAELDVTKAEVAALKAGA